VTRRQAAAIHLVRAVARLAVCAGVVHGYVETRLSRLEHR
jgi:hypothetical protein